MHADFTFYLNEYKGTAKEAEFSRLSVLANAHIDRITNGRALTATGTDHKAVKLAFCAVIDELIKQEGGGVVTSESNDGISRTYATSANVKSNTQRVYDAAAVFLIGTNLLYAGV